MKTFNQFLIDNPTFWGEHAEYPVAVQNMINDWYFYRYISFKNDVTYKKYLDRKLNLNSFQFLSLYNKQMAMSFDPIQLEKIEKTINTVASENANDIIKRILDGTVLNTGTNSLENSKSATNNNTKTMNLTTKTDEDATNTTTSTDTNNASTETKNSDYPQSTAGGFNNYISTAQINTTDSDSTSAGTTTIDGTSINLETGTVADAATFAENNDSINTLDLSLKTDNTEDTTKTTEIDKTINVIESEIKSGNGADLFNNYFKFIKSTNAVDWLIGILDECFLQVYNLEGYSENSDTTAALQLQINQLFAITSNLDTRVTTLEENPGGGGGTGDVTKAYVDAQDTLLRNSINTNTSNIATLTTKVNTNTSNIATLTTSVSNLNTSIATLTTNLNNAIADYTAKINATNVNVAANTANIATLTTTVNNAITDYNSKIVVVDNKVTVNTANIASLTTTVNNAIADYTAKINATNVNVAANTAEIATLTTNLNNAITDFTASITTTNNNVSLLDTRVTTLEQNPGGGGGDIIDWRVYKGTEYKTNDYGFLVYRNIELFIQGNNANELQIYLKVYRNIGLQTETNFATAPSVVAGGAYDYQAFFDLNEFDLSLISNTLINKNISAPFHFSGANYVFENSSSYPFSAYKNATGVMTYTQYTPPSDSSYFAVLEGFMNSNSKFAVKTTCIPATLKGFGANTALTEAQFNIIKNSYIFVKLV